MKVKVFILMMLSFILVSSVQITAQDNNAITFNEPNGSPAAVPLSMITSITHDVSSSGKVTAIINSKFGQYNIPVEIDETNFNFSSIPSCDTGWLHLPTNIKDDWDNAICNTEGLLVFKKESEDYTYIYSVAVNEKDNWLLMAFTKDEKAVEFVSSNLHGIISYDDQNKTQVFLCKDFTEIYEFDSHITVNSSRANALNNNGIGNIMTRIQGEYFPEKPSAWDSLQGLSETLSGYINPFFGNFVGRNLDYLKDSLKESRKKTLNLLFGSCKIAIIDAFNTDGNYYDYKLKVKVSEIASVPKNRYNNKQVGVYYGVIVKKDGIPYLDDYDIRKGEFITYDDVETSINLGELDIMSVYDAVPYLLSKAQMEYIKHCNWGDNNGKNAYDWVRFGTEYYITTHTPGIGIGPVQKTTCTTAVIPYSISFPPSGSTISLHVTNESGQEKTIQLSTAPLASKLILSDLMPGSNYTCTARLSYKDFSTSDQCSVSTLSPSITLNEVIDKTETSATISYSIGNELKDAQYLLIYSNENGSYSEHLNLNSSTITLGNLEPATEYSCYAKIIYKNKEWKSNEISFTTYAPSISGTWSVVETYSTRPFPGAEWQTKTREYSLILNEDGSIQISGMDYEYIGGSWGYGGGRFGATCHIIATQTQNSWDRFEGKVDDIKNPTKITGTRYRGNMNQVVNVENAVGSIVMTK